MANEMRDRLYDLLGECEKKYSAYYEEFIKQLDKAETQAEFEKIYDGVIKKHDFFADHLIENGVVVPPCKVGDSCYPLPRYRTPIVERKISRITYSARNIIIGYYENDGQYRPPLRTRTLGEDVFLTKAEAEQKLKEMRGEDK